MNKESALLEDLQDSSGRTGGVLVVISFGPVELKENGYLIRVWNMLESIRKVDRLKLVVLEFPDCRTEERIKIVNGIIFVHLRGNERPPHNKIIDTVRSVLTFDPLQVVKFTVLSFYELFKLRKIIAKANAVMVEGSLIFTSLIISKIMRKKVILDTHCINKLLAKRFKKTNKLVYMLRVILWDLLERISVKLSDLIIVVSPEEKSFVIKEYGVDPHKLLILPHIIESPRVISQKEVEKLRKSLGLEGKIIFTFVGDLRAVHNADAVNYILKELAPYALSRRRDVVFLIIGRGSKLFEEISPSNVLFTGYVEDLAPYIAMSDACIVPLRVGAGVKTKVLECLAYGKPVITTPVGIEGLENLAKEVKYVIVTDINSFKETLLNVAENLKSRKMKEFERDLSAYLEERYRNFYGSIKKVIEWIYVNT